MATPCLANGHQRHHPSTSTSESRNGALNAAPRSVRTTGKPTSARPQTVTPYGRRAMTEAVGGGGNSLLVLTQQPRAPLRGPLSAVESNETAVPSVFNQPLRDQSIAVRPGPVP
ncbi:unnamed protein product [Lota lota]